MQQPGKITIAPTVLTTIVRLTTLEQREVQALAPLPAQVRGLLARSASEEGILVGVTDDGVQVEVHVTARAGANMRKLGEGLQSAITRAIAEMVGMPVVGVDVHIDAVMLPAQAAEEI